MDTNYEEMLNRFDKLTVFELRNINRFYLHPQDKRVCSCCGTIYSGIRENFHIKKYYGKEGNRTIGWNVHCKSCKNDYSATLTADARKDPSLFITKRFSAYKHRAKELNVPFDLDIEYLIELFNKQDSKCYYTDEEISFENIAESRNRPHNLTPSLDRLVPELGYIKGNVVWCSYYLNRMKNDIPYSDFINLCKTVSDRFYHSPLVD